MPGLSKYRNKKTVVDNIRFDSKREANRYCDLKAWQKAGIIRSLELQPGYDLVVTGVETVRIGKYYADFRYVVAETGETVVEDAKGVRTPVYNLKKKLVRALHGIEIQEV